MDKDFFNNPQNYRVWSRVIDREWNQILPAGEFALARFIFDRTAGWAKEWEVIPIRHFTECVIGKDGTNYGGIHAKTRGTIIRHLRSLVEKGAVLREIAGKSFSYSLNYDWEPEMKTPQSKKAKDRFDKRTSDRFDNRTDEGSIIEHKEKKKEIPSGKGSKRLPPLADEKEEIVRGQNRVRERSASRRKAQKAEGYNIRGNDGGFIPTDRAMKKTWEDLHLQHFNGSPCAPLSNRAIHMVRSYCREWNERNRTKEFMEDYLPWLFRNWSILRKTSLSWMMDSPSIPQPMFVANAKMRPHLEEGWQKKSRIEAMAKMSPRQREIELLKDRGVDADAAEQMATEQEVTDSKLKQLRLEQRKLELMKSQTRQPNQVAKKISRSVRPPNESNKCLPDKLPEWED